MNSAITTAAVSTVARKLHRYAAATSTKMKNAKNGLAGPDVNSVMQTAQMTSIACSAAPNVGEESSCAREAIAGGRRCIRYKKQERVARWVRVDAGST